MIVAEGIRFALDLPSRTEPRHFKVRPVAEGDMGAVAELLRHAPGVSRHRPPTEAPQAASAKLGVFDDMRVLRGFVEVRAGAPASDACFIELIVIDPRYRRAGLGAAIVAELARRLKDAGARRFMIEVDEPNTDAMRFWQRHGFVETGRTDHRRMYERLL